MKRLRINYFTFIFVPIALYLCITGKVDWYVFIMIILSDIKITKEKK